MAQSAPPRAWGIIRRLLVGLSLALGVGATVGLTVAAARAAMRSSEFMEKLLLSLVDKAALAIGVAFVGFWLQKQLEIFKRDQGLAAELAKARIAAYNRAFAAVGAFDSVGNAMLLRRQRLEKVGKLAEDFDKVNDELFEVMRKDRYLFGEPFIAALVAYTHRLREDVRQALSDAPPSAEELSRRREKRVALRNALMEQLPPFARIPEDDQNFRSPDFNQASIDVLLEMDPQVLKK